jgi:hypothetical protein
MPISQSVGRNGANLRREVQYVQALLNGKKRTQGPPAAVGKTFRAFDPHQVMLLPPSLDDWLPEGHLARFVADLVDEVLDLSPVLADYTESAATHPTTHG